MKKILMNNRGQGVMEYMIITSLVGIICITAVKALGSRVQKRLEQASDQITESIKIN